MQGATVVRDDGAHGQVVAEERPGHFLVEFTDGSRFVVSVQAMVQQSDGSFRLAPGSHLQDATESEEVTIPVVAEELTIEKYKVARAKVRVQKREPLRTSPWSAVEADSRRIWEEKNPGTWDKNKAVVKYAYERVRSAR